MNNLAILNIMYCTFKRWNRNLLVILLILILHHLDKFYTIRTPSSEKTVPDDKKLIQDAVNELLQSNDVIITCGGIGPTEDDFTKEVILKCLT